MICLRLLGGFSVERESETLGGRAAQRKRLALLCLLAGSGSPVTSRDRLIGLLWPDLDGERARHLLSSSVYELRRALGEQVIVAVGDDLAIDPSAVDCDVGAFRGAISRRDWRAAVELYGGPFLDGFFVANALEFERWVERERDSLARQYAGALEALAGERERDGDPRGAVEAWRRLAVHDPYDSGTALRLMRALAAAGDRLAAVRHAGVHGTLLREEHGMEPSAEIAQLAERLRREGAGPTPAPAGAGVAGDAPEPAGAREPGAIPPGAAGHAHPVPRAAAARRPRGSRRRPVLASLLAMLLITGASWAALLDWRAEAGAGGIGSLAVLPFTDMTPEGDFEYFGDGIAEELIHTLAQAGEFRVVARTSAFLFKGRGADVREIGERLNADAVLEGSVRRDGGRVRITAQLIDARSGYHLWSEAYDRPAADLLAVQNEIAQAVMGRMHPAGERTAPVATAPGDAEAYVLYLRGRFLWNQGSAESLDAALALFRSAIERDSTFAPAHMGLSDTYNALLASSAARADGDELLRRAEEAALTALRHDPRLAEAHASLGHLRMYRWDWADAERDFRRAIELNPGYARAYQSFGTLLALQGKFDEAVAMMHRARELDPLSLNIHDSLAYVLYLARRYEEAERYAGAVVAMDADRVSPHLRLGMVRIGQGDYGEALTALDEVLRLGGATHLRGVPVRGYAYARAGRRAEAEGIRDVVVQGLPDNAYSAYFAVALFAALGENDRAFSLLHQLAAERHSCLVDFKTDPIMDPLRPDPRFARLVARIDGFTKR
jgi:TolB-like protein/DNA-binding SARP family transcriptional activator/tetratricopeptide (TPR) repeat protein